MRARKNWSPETRELYEATLSKKAKRELHKARDDIRKILSEIRLLVKMRGY